MTNSSGAALDADILVVVYDEPASCREGGDLAASAGPALFAEDFRPILGSMAVCRLSDDQMTAMDTIVHELFHALVRTEAS